MAGYVEVQCCKCGALFGVESGHHATLRRTGGDFYCSNGHQQSYKESEADRLRLERDRLKQQLAERNDEIARQRNLREIETRRVSAAKGQITKLKQRAKAGVCPCCNRTFSNMAAHMKTQHPDMDPTVIDLGVEKAKRA